MAPAAHEHIIEEPEEEYGSEEIKQSLKKTARKNYGRRARRICLESVQPHVSNS